MHLLGYPGHHLFLVMMKKKPLKINVFHFLESTEPDVSFSCLIWFEKESKKWVEGCITPSWYIFSMAQHVSSLFTITRPDWINPQASWSWPQSSLYFEQEVGLETSWSPTQPQFSYHLMSFSSWTTATICLKDKPENPFEYSAVLHQSMQSLTRRRPRNILGFHSSFPPVLPHSVPAFTIFLGSRAHFRLARFLLGLAGCQKHSGSGKESVCISAILQWL